MPSFSQSPGTVLPGTALFASAALMSIVWALFVPRGLSVGAFTMFGLIGPLILLSGRTGEMRALLEPRHP